MSSESTGWVDADEGYSLSVADGKIICRNAKEKVLKSVPAKVKKTDVHESLKQMLEWLQEHERTCGETVEAWMLRSLPIPRDIIESVWSDDGWRGKLENAIVAPPDFLATGDDEFIGFLRGVDPDQGVGIVNIDGETEWIDADRVVIPHPVLLQDLEDFRELATELGIEQGLQQLFRETFEKPDEIKETTKSVSTFSNGKFEQLNWALSKCRTLGYLVRGGFATCPVWENGRQAEARYWIGSDYPEYETYTGDLMWVDNRERMIALTEVGPVAYSEGMRMASAIFAARAKDEDTQDDT